jgi:hypothetical protein
VGDWFFAGGFYARPAISPTSPHAALIDTTDPDFPDRSYYASWDNSAAADPNHPSVGANSFLPEPDGNYLMRVNAAPEPATIILIAATAMCLATNRGQRSSH